METSCCDFSCDNKSGTAAQVTIVEVSDTLATKIMFENIRKGELIGELYDGFWSNF